MTLILGRKIGMTQLFAEDGTASGCTVVEAGPCAVMQVRTQDRDGYDAVQLGFEDVRDSRSAKPQREAAKKAGQAPKRFLREERLAAAAEMAVGDTVTVEAFTVGDLVDVVGTTKGRGFAGVVKRHGFKGAKEMTHGTHEYKRHAGSIGCSAYPARVIKGKRMAGQMGVDRVTVRGLKVVAVYPDENLLLVKGAIPGPKNGLVVAEASAKS